jgi:membrane-associated phospholipid phosphatase
MIEAKTPRATKTVATARPSGARSNHWLDFPALSARKGGPAQRLGESFRALHPALVFTLVMLVGLAATAALSIALGLLTTRVLEPAWGIGAADERVNVWLAAHRTASRTDASLLGSIVAGGVVLPIVVGSIALACALLRKWRIAAFVVFALAVESLSYRLTTMVIHSHRPRVVRLESLPVNASYPSGHTAAAIAVYGGLALLITSKLTNGAVRAIAWTLVPVTVTFVAMSRMYRGMHHPLDVAGGVVVGIVAITAVVFACRVAEATADARARLRGKS